MSDSHYLALGIEYDGRSYCGWQTQPDQPTVQDALERALGKFVTEKVPTICAGRTDTGVDGSGQVVSIAVNCDRPMRNWIRGVNTFLPDDIVVRWARVVDKEFSARFCAFSRTYEYWICNDAIRSPIFHGRTGWVWRACDANLMHAEAQCLVGEHDFTSFRASECQAATPIRTIESIQVRRVGKLIGIEITANAFLQHMVRNIVGSLVYVGIGRERAGWLRAVLEARERAVAAPTFDPSGLYLVGVRYPESYELPSRGASPFVLG